MSRLAFDVAFEESSVLLLGSVLVVILEKPALGIVGVQGRGDGAGPALNQGKHAGEDSERGQGRGAQGRR